MQHGFAPGVQASRLPVSRGTRAIVSGSCSAATNAQVAAFIAHRGPAFAVEPLRIAAGQDVVTEALDWARPRLADGPVLVYATADAASVREAQQRLGAQQAGALVEDTLSRIAEGLVDAGVGQLIVAGGETSGACVQRLGITQLRIGPQIDPGVPWCHAAQQRLHLALKSGNFGATDFFIRAFTLL
jgi:3-dehydrotetronate 4-kinase